MSFIIRDFLTPSVTNFNMNSRLYQRFSKAWPTTWVNGKLCYVEKYKWFHAGSVKGSIADKEFYVMLGTSYKELVADKPKSKDEIEYIYFTLKSSKYNYGAPTKQDIVNWINGAMCTEHAEDDWAGETYCAVTASSVDVTVDYGGNLQKYIIEHKKDFDVIPDPDGDPAKATLQVYPFNRAEVRTVLHSDPWLYFANIGTYSDIKREMAFDYLSAKENTAPQTYFKGLVSTPVTSVTSTLLAGGLALIDDGSTFTPSGEIFNEVEYTITTGLETCTTSCDGTPIYTSTKGEVLGYKYTQTYTFTPVTVASSIVSEIYNVALSIENNAKSYDRYSRLTPADTLIKKAIYDMSANNDTDEIWEQGLLKVDAAANMKRWEFADLFSAAFDTGHKVEKASWWEKALSFIIIVVAIVVAVVAAVFCNVCATAMYPALAYGAAAATAAALALSLGGILLAVVGGPSAMRIVRTIGSFAQVVGIIAMVLGIANWVTNSFQEYAKQWAIQEAQLAADYTVTQFIKDVAADMLNSVVDAVVDVWSFMGDMFTGNFSATPVQLSDVSGFIDNMGIGLKVYNQFFNDQEQVDETLQEQTTKSHQFPEEMWATQEMAIYEPDALQKMDLLKEKNLGGNKTQAFLDQIA